MNDIAVSCVAVLFGLHSPVVVGAGKGLLLPEVSLLVFDHVV